MKTFDLRRGLRRAAVVFFSLYFCAAVQADSWPPPSLKIVSSPDGNTLLRIMPGHRGGKESFASVTVFSFDTATNRYSATAQFRLRNPSAPGDVLVTNDAKFVVTFDDYAELGRTDNVIVVYRGDGELVRAWTLSDIFTQEERAQFEHSTSSIWWRQNVRLFENKSQAPTVLVELGTRAGAKRWTLEFDVTKSNFTKR